jgi:hypothetical protein
MEGTMTLNAAVAREIFGLDLSESHLCENLYYRDSARIWQLTPDYEHDERLAMQVIAEMRKTFFVSIFFNDSEVEVILTDKDDRYHKACEISPLFGRTVCLAALRARGIATEGL